MERLSHRHLPPPKHSPICIALISLIHLLGFIGLILPEYTDLVVKVAPVALVLMYVLIVYSHPDKNRIFWLYMVFAVFAGFVIALMAVQTGDVFGSIDYGRNLGLKLADTPLIIGVYWAALIYSTGIFVRTVHVSNLIYKSLIGALTLLCFDILLEPIAMKYDYWSWKDMSVPFRNYIGWFVVSYLMLRFFYAMEFHKYNYTAIVFFFTHLAYLIAVNLWAL